MESGTGREGMSRRMRDIRCRKCNRLLMRGEVEVVEIKCPKCGYVQRIGREGEVKGEAVQVVQRV